MRKHYPEIRKLYETDIPIFAICLGHQSHGAGYRAGLDTKMKYGHRGGNHPVKDLTGRVYLPRTMAM